MKPKKSREMMTYLAAERARISAHKQILGPIYEAGRLVDEAYKRLTDEEKDLLWEKDCKL